MKLFSLAAAFLTVGLVHANPIIIKAPVEHLFVPNGFDNNDNVEVVVSGKFKNSCYSRNNVAVEVKDHRIDVTVTALYNASHREICEDVKIPYLENVTLGNLQAGRYAISVNGIIHESLTVNESSTNSVDDHLYAQIDYVELGFTGGLNGEVFLVGRVPECLIHDRLEVISNTKDTLSILPIMKKVSSACEERTYINIPLKFNPKSFRHDQILLFVRTMDGKSISTLVSK